MAGKKKLNFYDGYAAERAARNPEFAKALAAEELRFQLLESRQRAGLTQEEIAKRLGVSQPRVAEIESMDNDPRLSTLIEYARAVGAEIRVVQVDEPKAEYSKSKTKAKPRGKSKP